MKKEATQERAKKTVEIVLEAALVVLIEQGYEKAATNRIAERSGFGVGTLYQYFQDKEDVYRELVSRELERIVEVLEQYTLQPTLADSLRSLIYATSKTIREHPGTYRALEPLLAGPFKENREAARLRAAAAMAKVLEHHRAELTVDDPEVAAQLIIAIGEGIATYANPEYFSAEALEARALSMMLAALTMP